MRQMVLGAVIAFGLTVLVLSFLSNRSSPPPPPAVVDAGVVGNATPILSPPLTAKIPPLGAKEAFRGHPSDEPPLDRRPNVQVPDFLKKNLVPLNRFQRMEQLGPPSQGHEIVTDAGR